MTEFGTPRRHVAICESTNDLAREWASAADDPAPHGALVTADFQTQGRGRRGRRWEAPEAQSALMSFVLRPQVAARDAWQIGFVAALAAADALRVLGWEARLKWPNDVLLQGEKIAGVLIETVLAPAGHLSPPLSFAIAGIGLNVRQTAFDADNYLYPPTSLRIASGQDWVIEEVIQAVAAAFGDWDARYRQEGFPVVIAAWQDRLAVGAPVKNGTEQGILLGIRESGHPQIRLADGTLGEWVTLEV